MNSASALVDDIHIKKTISTTKIELVSKHHSNSSVRGCLSSFHSQKSQQNNENLLGSGGGDGSSTFTVHNVLKSCPR